MRICFVCSGNICRSPTAEVVLRAFAADAGVALDIDSAGTGGWHAGDDMDARSRATLERAGYTPSVHCAKQFTADLFAERDVVVALDSGHLDALTWLAAQAEDPAAARSKIVLLRWFDPQAQPDDLDVGDPYYGGRSGFRTVLAQIERACAGLLDAIERGRLAAGQQTESPPP